MKLLQQFKARIDALLCKHQWYRLPYHFIPGEPWLMKCSKCLKVSKLDHYLTDKEQL